MTKHILEVSQFDKDFLKNITEKAAKMLEILATPGGNNSLRHRVSANLFYEPSTRTSSSFATAMYRLGGNVVSINDVHYSSVSKGETLEDTVRTLEQYADCIVLRHPEVGAAKRAAAVAQKPIINAGDGAGEHPTQALLDIFTILQEKGMIDGLVITMVGDLKYGRTVHSLAKLLNHYHVTLNFVAPESIQFPEEYANMIHNTVHRTDDLLSVLPETDILYVTRIQKERFTDPILYESIKNSYIITNNILKNAKNDTTIMHPLPRVGEIHTEVDSDPRAAYFRQVRYGLAMRMALFDYILN